MGGLGALRVKLNVVQKLWLCVLVCTSFNFTKRWLFCHRFCLSVNVRRVSLGIGHNVLGLCEEAELEVQMFVLAQMFIRIPNVQLSTEPAFLQNPCCRLGLIVRRFFSNCNCLCFAIFQLLYQHKN